MLSLKPGETVQLGIAARIRFSLGGEAAEGVEVWRTGSDLFPLRRASRTDYVLELDADHAGEIILELRPSTPATSEGGDLFVEITPIAESAGQTLHLNGIRLQGAHRIPLAEVTPIDNGAFQLTSLVGARRAAGPSDVTEADWVKPPQRSVQAVILVDRSASMAWAFHSGLVNMVLAGVADGLSDGGSAEMVRCLSYGAAVEDDALQEIPQLTDPQRRFDFKPPMFSSGARIPWTSVSSPDFDLVFIVTDDPEPIPSKGVTEGPVVAFIRPSGTSDIERIPRELQLRIRACNEAGCPVLLASSQNQSQFGLQVADWVAGQLKRCWEVSVQ